MNRARLRDRRARRLPTLLFGSVLCLANPSLPFLAAFAFPQKPLSCGPSATVRLVGTAVARQGMKLATNRRAHNMTNMSEKPQTEQNITTLGTS